MHARACGQRCRLEHVKMTRTTHEKTDPLFRWGVRDSVKRQRGEVRRPLPSISTRAAVIYRGKVW